MKFLKYVRLAFRIEGAYETFRALRKQGVSKANAILQAVEGAGLFDGLD